jgi:uncharacterized protein (TIGR02147 family)
LHPLSEAQYQFFGSWYYVIVRVLVGLPGFKENPEWIAKKINPAITPAEAKRALQELLKLGLIERNEKGHLVQSNPNLTTSDAVTSSSLALFHHEMTKKAAESIDRVPRAKRDLSAMSLGISSETAGKIKEMTEKFRKDIVELANKDTAPNSVYQLNFYFFPIAEIGEKETET